MNIVNGWLEVGINNKENRDILTKLVCWFGGASEKKNGKLYYRAISYRFYDLEVMYPKRLEAVKENVYPSA